MRLWLALAGFDGRRRYQSLQMGHILRNSFRCAVIIQMESKEPPKDVRGVHMLRWLG
jgi:hypothetical protein